ncbi:hypothetical protein DUNSADRAFT_5934 [Dunaliella salina]|uniref:Uncharacterized protein n=1 Tax=Dunaliella salina TaxID=3046 RepID=A0ABQ7GP99_DUNSA|nr:hypothetical protein DUNSADRAFT_5934 [Dunaliella salina]|eukprot:KAF5836428.1 hypothetical protein DUNSADRAFT_5934 [Dunaliella salina]
MFITKTQNAGQLTMRCPKPCRPWVLGWLWVPGRSGCCCSCCTSTPSAIPAAAAAPGAASYTLGTPATAEKDVAGATRSLSPWAPQCVLHTGCSTQWSCTR